MLGGVFIGCSWVPAAANGAGGGRGAELGGAEQNKHRRGQVQLGHILQMQLVPGWGCF